MKIILKYYFDQTKNKFIPTCSSEINENNALTSYLNDDLGNKDEHKEFLNNTLNGLTNDIDKDISSNSWGIDMVDNNIHIYFLYDSDNEFYKTKLAKIEFVFIIKKWIEFLDRPFSNPSYQEIIDSEDAYLSEKSPKR